MAVEHANAAQADGRANLNPVRPRRSMDPKLAAAIAVKSHLAITNRTAGSAQLPPLTRLMGHIDRIDLLVEDVPLLGWGFWDLRSPQARPQAAARPA